MNNKTYNCPVCQKMIFGLSSFSAHVREHAKEDEELKLKLLEEDLRILNNDLNFYNRKAKETEEAINIKLVQINHYVAIMRTKNADVGFEPQLSKDTIDSFENFLNK